MTMNVKNRRKLPLAVILIPTIVLTAVLLLFAFNGWHVAIELNDGKEIDVEYGASYTEPGAQARFCGNLFCKEGFSLPVTLSGTVDCGRLGDYEIDYSAHLLFWSGRGVRTVRVVDTTPPVITLSSVPGHYTLPDHAYEEEGFTARDLHDGDLTGQVVCTEENGKVVYTVTDGAGNTAQTVREIYYDDPVPPVLTLLGEENLSIYAGTTLNEPGYEATDNCDGDLTDAVQVSGSVDIWQAGEYTLSYCVRDSAGNETTAQRKVTVLPLRQPDKVTPDGKVVYLTFDDGPSKYTQQLLDVLDKYNVKATFFTVGCGGYSDMIAKEAAAGHTIGIHSATHDYDKIYASEDAYFSDLYQQQELIYNKTGIRPTILRFPGGSSNTVSSFNPGIMTTLTKDVTDLGMQYFDWNVSSGDAGQTTDTQVVFENVIAGIQSHNVSVVLQHDSKGYSVDAVEKIIVWGLANGYTFLPLDASSPTAHHHLNN